jgi:uncharacterized phage-associated protein
MFEPVRRPGPSDSRLYARSVGALTAADVAEELKRRLPGLGLKKQHKLLYYCQGHHLGAFGEPLFDDTISAWDMGPVVGQLWFEQREGTAAPSGAELTEAQLNTIGYVISRYGGLTGADLERLSHAEPPWQEADRMRHPRTSAKISVESMRAYFSSSVAAGDDDDDAPLPDAEAVAEWLGRVSGGPRESSGRPDTVESLRTRVSGG